MIRKSYCQKILHGGKPLPQSQWAQPSAALQDMNAFLYKVYEPGGVSFMEAMVKWQEHCSANMSGKKWCQIKFDSIQLNSVNTSDFVVL